MPRMFEKLGRERAPEEISPDEFARRIGEATGEEVIVNTHGDTHEIDTNSFNLTFVLDDDSFEIRNIEARASGVGSIIIKTIHDYCDEHELEVYASSVKDTAEGFWRKIGYEEGQGGQFFRTM